MSTNESLTHAITAALPPDLRHLSPQLVAVIHTALTSRTSPTLNAVNIEPLQSLAGRQLSSGASLISFGANNQFGDILFQGDIVGGDKYEISVTIPPDLLESARAAARLAPRLFLCYSRADGEQADALALELQLRGVRIWRDTEQIFLGRLSRATIKEAIDTVTALLIYLTPASLRSEFIPTVEIKAALQRARRDPGFVIIPLLDGVSPQEVDAAFSGSRLKLTEYQYLLLPNEAAGRAHSISNLARQVLRAVLVPALHADRRRSTSIVDLFTISRTTYDRPAAASLDWTSLCTDGVPSLETWRERLLPALTDLEKVLREDVRRPITLRPDGTRISPAFGFGYVFRETSKFHLWVEQVFRSTNPQWWRTDEPHEERDLLTDTSEDHDRAGIDFTLEISINRVVSPTVNGWLNAAPAPIARRIKLDFPPRTISDGAQAMMIAGQVQRTLDRELGRRSPERIHLFFAGPVALAILIGWHLNKRGVFVAYEFVGNRYVPAVEFGG